MHLHRSADRESAFPFEAVGSSEERRAALEPESQLQIDLQLLAVGGPGFRQRFMSDKDR